MAEVPLYLSSNLHIANFYPDFNAGILFSPFPHELAFSGFQQSRIKTRMITTGRTRTCVGHWQYKRTMFEENISTTHSNKCNIVRTFIFAAALAVYALLTNNR